MAKTEWYVHMMGEATGPFGETVVAQMLKQNRLQFTDFGWTKGMKSWKRFTEVDAFAELMPPAPTIPIPTGEAEDEETAAPVAPVRTSAKVVPIRTKAEAAPVAQPAAATARSGANSAVAKQGGSSAAAAAQQVAPAPEIHQEASAPVPAAAQKHLGRRQWRVPIDATITLQGYGEFKVLDISEGGLLLECRDTDKLEIGTDLKLRVASPSFAKPLDMTGVLVREEEFENKRCYGVEFTKVNPAHKRTLATYVAGKLQLGE